MHRPFLKQFLILIAVIGIAIASNGQTPKFTEGVVYSRTSFPGHPINDALKKLDYEKGDFVEQYNAIQALGKYQKSIKGENQQEINDAFFVSAIMLIPSYSKMYYSSKKILVKTEALGYNQETLINIVENSGMLILSDRNKSDQGTIRFKTQDIKEVWHKYHINAEQYTIQKTTETAVIAGYTCKKIIYNFNGTSRGPAGNMLLNMQPQKVTAWYSDELNPLINLLHPLYFEILKAVLKFEIEYLSDKKNKTLVEITKFEAATIDAEKLEINEIPPIVEHKKNGTEAGMFVMQVMMSAISLLTK